MRPAVVEHALRPSARWTVTARAVAGDKRAHSAACEPSLRPVHVDSAWVHRQQLRCSVQSVSTSSTTRPLELLYTNDGRCAPSPETGGPCNIARQPLKHPINVGVRLRGSDIWHQRRFEMGNTVSEWTGQTHAVATGVTSTSQLSIQTRG